MTPHRTKYAASRYQPMPGGKLYVDLVPFIAQRFLVLAACAHCHEDALCNYSLELNAAFCGPDCKERVANGETYAE